MNKHYELLCIFPGTLAEDELPALLEKTTTTIEEMGGEHINSNDMGKSRLSYPMKHIRYGYFFLVSFQMAPGKIPALQQKLRLITELLRIVLHTYNPNTKQALKTRLTELKSRIEARTGMGPKEEEEAPVETKKEVKPKKKTVKKAVSTKTKETEADTTEAEKKTETNDEKEKKAAPKKKAADKEIDMKDIDKKLDALLDDTMSDL
jgi:small subunit ribosomal protein S6